MQRVAQLHSTLFQGFWAGRDILLLEIKLVRLVATEATCDESFSQQIMTISGEVGIDWHRITTWPFYMNPGHTRRTKVFIHEQFDKAAIRDTTCGESESVLYGFPIE